MSAEIHAKIAAKVYGVDSECSCASDDVSACLAYTHFNAGFNLLET